MLRLIDQHLMDSRRTIADLGPGNGALLRLSLEIGFTRLLAVDHTHWDPKRSFLTDLDEVEFVHANFNAIRFLGEIGDETTDVVVTTEVLEHVFNHPWGFLVECWRIVRPGGLLVISTPNPCTLANALRLVLGRRFLWGDVWFATTPKVENGDLVAYPFVHYREYPPTVFRNLLSDLPDATIVAASFLAMAAERSGSRAKALGLTAIRWLGLSHWRPVSHSQYAIVKKTAGHSGSSG